MENETKNNPFMKYMSNPRTFTLKKWFSGILKEKFSKHESTVERVSAAIVTDSDLKEFGELMGELFEVGYMKAVDDYRDQLEKIGVKIKIGNREDINP